MFPTLGDLMTQDSQLCSVPELKKLIGDNTISVLDCSWFLPSANRNPESEFQQKHIPGARFFNVDLISDQGSDLPHMLPSANEFANEVGRMGIGNDSHVVVYDTAGLFSAARVWWTFKVFGHNRVQVLDGGLPAWVAAGGELSNDVIKVETVPYQASLNSDAVIDKAELIDNIQTGQYTVLDARSEERFLGIAPEPRPGLPSGHMPQSKSLPFSCLIENGRLKSRQDLLILFENTGIDVLMPLVTSCGSGVTAAIITFALVECGFPLNRLYDGAWSEWGNAGDTEVLGRANK